MRKIVILDGYTENPGDLSWAPFEALGEVTVYDRTPTDQIIPRIGNAEIVIVNKTPLRSETLAACPSIRYIGVLTTGYDVVDVQAARARGIPMTNVPAYGTAAVGQYAIAMLLEICHHIAHHAQAVREGRWQSCPDWCFWDYPLIELDGKTLGKDFSVLPSLGIVLENVGLFTSMTGKENLKYLAGLTGRIGDKEITHALERVGLDPDDNRTYKKYSLGMKQRLAIAQAIMESPDVIMLDEPTNGLDDSGVKLIRNLIMEEKQRGAIVLLASHNRDDIRQLADKLYHIESGELKELEAMI